MVFLFSSFSICTSRHTIGTQCVLGKKVRGIMKLETASLGNLFLSHIDVRIHPGCK